MRRREREHGSTGLVFHGCALVADIREEGGKRKKNVKVGDFSFHGCCGRCWSMAGLEDVVRGRKKERKTEDLVLSCLGCEGSWRADL